MTIERGDIHWANFDPSIGSEIKKMRPCIIVSNNIANTFSSLVTVVPITTQKLAQIYPHEVRLENIVRLKNSKVKVNQLRTIDKRRLKGFLAKAPRSVMRSVDVALALHLSLK